MSTMKKIYTCTIFGFLLLVFFKPAFAEEILFFSPTRVNLTDEKPVETITISNLSNIARAYSISVEDLIMTQDGVTAPVDHFDYSAKRMIRFVPREFILQPGDKQTIRIMSRTGTDTTAGDYHSHMRFLEDVTKRQGINPPPKQGGAIISAPLAYEAMIPVVVSHGPVSTTVGLTDAKIAKEPKSFHYKASLILSREGNGQGVAYIDTNYTAPDGTSTTAAVRRTVYIYRELDAVKKEYEFSLPENSPAGGKITISLYDNPSEEAQPLSQITLPLPE